MANPYTDPRYEMARLMRAQKSAPAGGFSPSSLGPAPSGASVRLGRAARNLSSANPSLRSQIEAISSGSAKPEQKGVVGTVLGNPVTKTALNALGVLAIPGRAVVATGREIADVLDTNPNTKASLGDFVKNVKDPTYGFGKAFHINTGDKWLDRAIGFVGDVATDPLTYATFGAGKFAGYTGRLDLAKAVLTHTGDEALANAVQRFGRAAIKDVEILDRVGANRHGIYFFGKRIKPGVGIRVPGSGAIGQLGDNVLSKLRVSAMGTKGGRWIQKMTLPAEALAARQALLQGEVGNKAASVVISYLTASPIARMTSAEVLQREESLLASFLKSEANLGLDGYKNEIYKYLEKPELLAQASPEVQRATQQWSEVFQWYERQVNDAIQAADPTFEFSNVERYFPHMHTDASFQYRADMANPHARKLNEIWARDPLEGGGNFKSRTLREGDDWFGTKLTAAQANDVEFLNDVARPHLGGENFFETDITKVMPKYLDEFSKEMGLLARHKHLADTGFWKRAEDISVTGEFIDKELVDTFKQQVGSLSDEMANLHIQSANAHLDLRNALEGHLAGLKTQLDDLTSAQGDLGAMEAVANAEKAIDDVLSGSVTVTADTIRTIADNVGSVKRKFASIFGYDVTRSGQLVVKDTLEPIVESHNTVEGLVSYLDNLEVEMQKSYDNMMILEKDVFGQELKDVHARAQAEVGLMTERLKEAQTKLQEVSTFGNQIESAVDSIITNGVLDVDSLNKEVAQILAISGASVGIAESTTRDLIGSALGLPSGRMQTLVTEQTQIADGLFKQLSSSSPLRSERVIKMSVKDFYDTLPKMFTGELELQQVREMGLWALLRDDVVHAGNIPAGLVSAREKLVAALRDADVKQAMSVAAKKESSAAGKMTSEKALSSFFEGAYKQIMSIKEESVALQNWLASPNVKALIDSNLLDENISEDVLRMIVDAEPAMQKFFPSASRFDEIQDLMGAYDSYGGKMQTVVAGNTEYTDIALSRGASGASVNTYRDLLDSVSAAVENNNRIMNERIFVLGSGVGKQEFTGEEIISRMNRVKGLKAVRSGRQREIAAEAKRIFDNTIKNEKFVRDEASRQNLMDSAMSRAAQIVERRNIAQGRMTASDIRKELSSLGAGQDRFTSSIGGAASNISKERLAESIMGYQMVSDVIVRYKAVAARLAPFGLVPTEKMFAAVTKNVGNKFIPIVESQIRATNRAAVLLTRLDSEIAAAIGTAGESGLTPSQIFKNFMSGLNQSERDVLVEAMGSRVAWTADPVELRVGRLNAMRGKGKELVDYNGRKITAKKVAELEYFSKHVRPWFESAFPGTTPTYNNMWDALKMYAPTTNRTQRRAFITPWGDGANVSTIKNWFEDILGSSSIPGRSSKRLGTVRLGGNMGGAKMTGLPILDTVNDINTKLSNLRNMHRRFTSMLAPDASMELFVKDPFIVQRTPTFYLSLLRGQVEDISRMLEAKGGVAVDIANTQSIVDDVLKQIDGFESGARGFREGRIPSDMVKQIEDARAKVAAHSNYKDSVQQIKDELKTINERINGFKGRKLSSGEKAELASLRKNRNALTRRGNKLTEPAKPSAKDMRLAEAGPAMRTKSKRGFIEPIKETPAQRAARSVLDEYNTLMTSPAYADAKNDELLQRALERLSGFEMWKYGDGFSLDGETFASLGDGTRIVFSREEWESLFNGVRSKVEMNVRLENAVNDLNLERGKLLTAQRNAANAKAKFDIANSALSTFDAGDADFYPVGRAAQKRIRDGLVADIQNARAVSAAADVEVKKQLSVVADARLVHASFNPDIRDAALEKMRILVHGGPDTPAGKSIFSEEGLNKFDAVETPYQRQFASAEKRAGMPGVEAKKRGVIQQIDTNMPEDMQARLRQENAAAMADVLSVHVETFNKSATSVDASTAARRMRALKSVWEKSDSYATLSKLASLEQNMFVAKYRSFLDSASSMREYLYTLRDSIARMESDAAGIAGDIAATGELAVSSAGTAIQKLKENIGGWHFITPPADSSVDELNRVAAEIEANIVRGGPAVERVAGSATKTKAMTDVLRAKSEQMGAMGRANAAEQRITDWLGEPAAATPRTAKTANQQWLLPEQPRNVGARQPLLKEAVGAWKARSKSFETVGEVVSALQETQSGLRQQMVIKSGSVEQFWREIADGRAVAQSLQTQIDSVSSVIERLPAKDMTEVIKRMAKGKGKISQDQIDASLQAYRSWVEEARPLLSSLSQNPDDPVAKAYVAAHIADGQLIDIEIEHMDKLLQLSNASIPTWKTTVIEPLAEGYEAAARESGLLNGLSLQGDPRMLGLRGDSEAVALLKNIERIREPGVVDDMARFMRGYTGFFRSYATLSPGFHVRNQISNVFSMFSGGADFNNMREGFRLWRSMDDHLSKGGTLQSWVATLPAEQRDFGLGAARIQLGLGGGKTDDALEAFARTNSEGPLRNNWMIRKSRSAGHKVEGSARYMMAYDSLVKGMDENVAFNRVKRYLIDYHEKTLLDETMRDIVPFWTWMSRNLPLQVINRWTNPKAYMVYQHAYQNFNQGNELLPSYMRDKMAIALGGGNVFNPDLPFTGVNEQIAGFADPSKLMGYVNPGLRVPVEMLADKSFFTGQKFGNDYVKLDGKFAMLEPLFAAAGQLERNSKGEAMVRKKAMYAMTNMIPFMSRIDRLVPSDGADTAKSQNAVNSFLGVPFQHVSAGMMDGENMKKLAQLKALAEKRKKLG